MSTSDRFAGKVAVITGGTTGIGRAIGNSITGRDYPLIMGTTIILACLIIIMNLVSDLLYKIVDPRIELD